MRKINRSLLLGLLALTAGASLTLPLPAQAQKATKMKRTAALPKAEKIMDDSTAATGGKAFRNIKTMTMRGTLSLPAQKITGTMETYMKLPSKVYVKQEIKGIGVFEQGFDGTVGWSRDPINGLRTLTGKELTQLKSEGDNFKSSDWRSQYTKAETIGLRKVGTADAWAVRLTPKSGSNPVVTFFDVKTKLPIRTDVVIESPQGSVPTQSFLSDYRVVGGVKVPFTTRQVIGAAEAIQHFDSVKFNETLDDAKFSKPAAPVAKP